MGKLVVVNLPFFVTPSVQTLCNSCSSKATFQSPMSPIQPLKKFLQVALFGLPTPTKKSLE